MCAQTLLPPPPSPVSGPPKPTPTVNNAEQPTSGARTYFLASVDCFAPPPPPLPPHHACGQVLLQWTRFFFSLKNVEDNRRWLVGNQRRLEGNHLDMWVASGLKIKLAGETAAVKMSKIGDVRTFGLHQTKDKKFLVERLPGTKRQMQPPELVRRMCFSCWAYRPTTETHAPNESRRESNGTIIETETC